MQNVAVKAFAKRSGFLRQRVPGDGRGGPDVPGHSDREWPVRAPAAHLPVLSDAGVAAGSHRSAGVRLDDGAGRR